MNCLRGDFLTTLAIICVEQQSGQGAGRDRLAAYGESVDDSYGYLQVPTGTIGIRDGDDSSAKNSLI